MQSENTDNLAAQMKRYGNTLRDALGRILLNQQICLHLRHATGGGRILIRTC